MARKPEDVAAFRKVDGKRVNYTTEERAALAAAQDAAEAKLAQQQAVAAVQRKRTLVVNNIEQVLAALGMDDAMADTISNPTVSQAVKDLLP